MDAKSSPLPSSQISNFNDYDSSRQASYVIHAWCRWRVRINDFLIDRMKLANIRRRNRPKTSQATSYFVILNGIEVPPDLTSEKHQEFLFTDKLVATDPRQLDWHLKHSIPRAICSKRPASLCSSWGSLNSQTNSDVSFGHSSGSGVSSVWTSASSNDSDADPAHHKDREHRRKGNRKKSDRNLLTWSRLKLKLIQRKRRSGSTENVNPSSLSRSTKGGSSDTELHLSHHRNNSSSSSDFSSSVNSRKFPMISKIFLPNSSGDEKGKYEKTPKQDPDNHRFVRDLQGRVFININNPSRLQQSLSAERLDDGSEQPEPHRVQHHPVVRMRPRLRIYGFGSEPEMKSDDTYPRFMYDRFEELYQEDAKILTNLKKENGVDRKVKQKKVHHSSYAKPESKHNKQSKGANQPPSGFYLQHYGKF